MTFINQKLLFLGLLLLASLSACENEKPTYAYLMQHPDYLERSYRACAEQGTSSPPCDTILRSQADFVGLINQREQDPERFGARVLQEEENKAFLRKQFKTAQKAYQQESQEKLRLEMDKREQAYQASVLRVNTLLAVIAATSSV